MEGHCGIVNVNHRDARFKEQPCQIAAVVPKGTRDEGGWMVGEWLSRGVSSLFNLGSDVDGDNGWIRADMGFRRSARWLCLRSMLWLPLKRL